MLITCHLLTGAAIASGPINPTVSLPLAFFSHFILDAIPHLEATTFANMKKGEDYYPTKKEILYVFLDVLFGLLVLSIIYFKLKSPLILFGAFLAILPDLIDNIPFWYGIRKLPVFKQFHKFHDKIHFDLKPRYWYWGALTQFILLAAVACYFLSS